MKRKNTIFLSLLIAFALICLCGTPAHAGNGTSCSSPIELTPNYSETVWTAGTIWYVANTFDLPLAIDFYPAVSNTAAPELYLDFSCTPGVYSDSILCGLFCQENSGYIQMPYKQIPTLSYDDQNRARYHMEFGQFYRDMLLRQGIDYNVPVYIRAVFSCGGQLSMEPDAFNSCMDGPKFMHLGDTVQVQANDKNRHVIVPYVQWQYDSIRYVWNGTQPCTIAVGNKCGFDPTTADATIIDAGVIQPGGVFKVSSELLMQYVSDQKNYPNDAGMYFAKFYSEAPGVIKIEKIPAPAPAGGAEILKYGVKTNVFRNDTSKLYAIPSSWVKSMQFATPTERVFKMYIGATPNFYTKDAFATFQFDKTDDGHELSLFASDMADIWTHKLSGENYLYIRFECSDNTTVLPMLWTPSDCITKAQRIQMGATFDVAARSKVVYGLFYEEMRGGDLKMSWSSTQSTCPFFIADTCDVPNDSISPAFFWGKVPKKGTDYVCPQATVETWAPYVDPDGYLYIRFYSTGKAKITVSTTAPEETDPPCDTYDSTLTVTAWDTYTWRGTPYTQSGNYTIDGTVDPETGCMDSTFTLRLTIHTTSYDELPLSGCDTVEYNNKKYTESGQYIDTVYDAVGNRTIMTLNVSVNYSSTGDTLAVACSSFTWYGTPLTSSGDYTHVLTNAVGCDSVVTLHLTINHPTTSDTTAAVCGGIEWHGQTYTESGDYTYTTTNVAGCDSTRTLHLTVYPLSPNTDTTAVEWDSIAWYGQIYTASGDYSIQKRDGNGCDYTHTLHLTVHTTTHTLYSAQGCDSVLFNGTKYTRNGEFADTAYTADGNRVITTLSVTINHPTTGDTTAVACGGFTWYGTPLATSGDYTHVLTNVVGCDSIVTLHLTVHQPTTGDTSAVACGAFTWYGTPLSTSGDYTHVLTNVAGCDSTVTLHLTIHQPTSSDTTAVACEQFDWRGTTYTQSGDYPYLMEGGNSHGCDSTVTLHLTINHPTTSDTTAAVCGGIEWHGQTYTESGDYTYSTTNVAGCDSTRTLHLTVYPLSPNTDTTAVEWDSIAWYGQVYTESGDYSIQKSDGNGCDYTHTLHLTVHTTTHDAITRTDCDSIMVRGRKYTQSGVYIDTIYTEAGNRIIETKHLTIHTTTYSSMTVTACEYYTSPSGKIYTVSKTYVDTVLNRAGCDSVITIALTVEQDCYTYDTVYFCHGLNTEHDEHVSGDLIRRYRTYTYESPDDWDYMEGVFVSGEGGRSLLDLHHAEQNLYAHYTNGLEPVSAIYWSLRPEGETAYRVLTAESQPQWVEAGVVALQVQFLCGHVYRSNIATDVETVREEQTRGRKVLMNGELFIIRGGVKYTLLGTKID